jgi:hypothetical protein
MFALAALVTINLNIRNALASRTELLKADEVGYVKGGLIRKSGILGFKIVEYIQNSVGGWRLVR